MNREKLRDRMTANNVSMTEMSKALGIGRKALWSKCNGYTEFKLDEIIGIVHKLGLTKHEAIEIFFDREVSKRTL